VGLAAPEVLEGELQAFGLGDHAEVHVLVEGLWQTRNGQHQVVALVPGIVLVVVVHRGAVMISLILRYRAPQGLADRRGVHPELAYKPPHILSVAKVGDVLRRGVLAWLLAEAAG
jgi:hypothetical protein